MKTTINVMWGTPTRAKRCFEIIRDVFGWDVPSTYKRVWRQATQVHYVDGKYLGWMNDPECTYYNRYRTSYSNLKQMDLRVIMDIACGYSGFEEQKQCGDFVAIYHKGTKDHIKCGWWIGHYFIPLENLGVE